MTTGRTGKTNLDGLVFEAELALDARLWLLDDTNKSELVLSPRATYDLLVFLQEHAQTIYEATHCPQESYLADDIISHATILAPVDNEGELAPPPEKTLYADVSDPYLSHVFAIAQDWAHDSYEGAARVVRIVLVDTAEDEPETIPDFLKPLTSWVRYDGEADQSWKVTIWPQAGWQHGQVNHLYVHQIDNELVTGGSESDYSSTRPRRLLLPFSNEDDWENVGDDSLDR